MKLSVGFKAGGVLFWQYCSGWSAWCVHALQKTQTSCSFFHPIEWVGIIVSLPQPSTTCSSWNNTNSFNSVGPASIVWPKNVNFALQTAWLHPHYKSTALLIVNILRIPSIKVSFSGPWMTVHKCTFAFTWLTDFTIPPSSLCLHSCFFAHQLWPPWTSCFLSSTPASFIYLF